MHGVIAGFLIAMVEPPAEELGGAGKSSWIMFVSAAFLCLFTLFYLLHLAANRRLPKGLKWWVVLSTPVVWIMLAQGVADWPRVDLLHTMRRGVPWVGFALLPALGAPEFRPRLKRILKSHVYLGIPVCAWVLATHWEVVTSKTLYLRAEGMEVKQGKALLYPIFFLLFQLKELPLYLKIVTGVGILILAIQAVVSATRQAVLLLGVALVIGGWTYLRQRSLQGRQNAFLKTALVVSMVVIAGASLVPHMTGALLFTHTRFAEESGSASLRENARLDELRAYFLEQATLKDFIFGRGVNGRYLHPEGGYAETMHIGYGRYALKGGVPLVLLLVFGPLAVGVRLLFRSTSPDVSAAAGMCVWFGAKNFTGSLVGVHPQFFLIVISLGICFFALGKDSEGETSI